MSGSPVNRQPATVTCPIHRLDAHLASMLSVSGESEAQQPHFPQKGLARIGDERWPVSPIERTVVRVVASAKNMDEPESDKQVRSPASRLIPASF